MHSVNEHELVRHFSIITSKETSLLATS